MANIARQLPRDQHFPKPQPSSEEEMQPAPQSEMEHYRPAGKLKDKVAIVTGADSGIGRATAIGFAKEGADVAILYFKMDEDAERTRACIEAAGRKAILCKGDIGDEDFCRQAVEQAVETFGKLDIVVNNAAEQHQQDSIEDISTAQLERTFRTNIFGMFHLVKAAVPHLKHGSAIINTTSVTAYKGKKELIDYASTKGAIVAFTRSLAQSLAERGIRVNAVAPGPIWTPLIVSSFDREHIEKFGSSTLLGRPGQPDEVAPSFIFLASDDASYMTGQVLHPNGGDIVNG